MTDLTDFDDDPDQLERFGYSRRNDGTADVVRSVWFEKAFATDETQVQLTLQIEFELGLSDDPFVTYAQNCSYSFNGVYLRVFDRRMEPFNNLSFDEDTARPVEIDRYRLCIGSLEDCERLAQLLKPGFRPWLSR